MLIFGHEKRADAKIDMILLMGVAFPTVPVSVLFCRIFVSDLYVRCIHTVAHSKTISSVRTNNNKEQQFADDNVRRII